MAKKKEFVRHKVVRERQYEVYSIEGLTLNLLTLLTCASRPHEVDLCKEYKVKKVIVQEVEGSAKYDIYEMPLDDFMKAAKKVDEDSTEQTETAKKSK